jgi:DNA-binding transcriptional LysR family regulator
MNIRRLGYFVVVAEEENLHRASLRLHVAQPALTRQIRLLEEELGTTLFNRLPRGISLSIAGQSFLEDARQILRLSDQARKRAAAVATGQRGTLRVGFHDAAHSYPLLRLAFSSFHAEFSDVHFRCVSSSSDQQMEALRSKDLDLGFIYRWDKSVDEFECLSLAQDELALALPIRHRLANKAVICADDLREELFIWGDPVSFRGHTDAIMRACVAAGFVPRLWHQGLTSSAAMISLVAAGIGLAIVPRQTIMHPQVVTRHIERMNGPVELLLAWNRDQSSPAVANFVRHATAARAALQQADSAKPVTATA